MQHRCTHACIHAEKIKKENKILQKETLILELVLPFSEVFAELAEMKTLQNEEK